MRYRIDIDTEVAQRVLADGDVPALRLTGGLPAQAKSASRRPSGRGTRRSGPCGRGLPS